VILAFIDSGDWNPGRRVKEGMKILHSLKRGVGYLQSQQDGSRPVNAAFIMADAHPAPLLTAIAAVGQLI